MQFLNEIGVDDKLGERRNFRRVLVSVNVHGGEQSADDTATVVTAVVYISESNTAYF